MTALTDILAGIACLLLLPILATVGLSGGGPLVGRGNRVPDLTKFKMHSSGLLVLRDDLPAGDAHGGRGPDHPA